jgi:hypothetical protein
MKLKMRPVEYHRYMSITLMYINCRTHSIQNLQRENDLYVLLKHSNTKMKHTSLDNFVQVINSIALYVISLSQNSVNSIKYFH